MREKIIKVGKINELPAKQKQKILDDRRDMNVSYDWWDSTIEGFITLMEEKGVQIGRDNRNHVNIHFDFYPRFCSFSTKVIDNRKFIEAYGLKDKYPLIYGYPACFNVWVNTTGRDDSSMSSDCEDLIDDDDRDQAFGLKETLALATWESQTESYLLYVEDQMREEAGNLFKSLEEDYDYLQSDEHIEQVLLDNEEEWEIEEEENGI